MQKLIRGGGVTVDGAAVRDPSAKCDPERQALTVGGRPLGYKKHLYVMLNKPAGILCVSRDPKAATVVDLLPPALRRRGMFPAGRLDKDTHGLVLLTDDGDYAHRMLSPKKAIFKRYQAVLDGPADDRHVALFHEGTKPRGRHPLPAGKVDHSAGRRPAAGGGRNLRGQVPPDKADVRGGRPQGLVVEAVRHRRAGFGSFSAGGKMSRTDPRGNRFGLFLGGIFLWILSLDILDKAVFKSLWIKRMVIYGEF